MKIILGFISLFFTVTLCFSGCSSINSMSVHCDELLQRKNISKQIEVNAGDTFSVDLCSNVSTGFSWLDTANVSNKIIIEQTSHKRVAPLRNIPGAPGQQVWTFKALKNGTALITNEYSQPWSGGQKSEWTFMLDVKVK